MPSCSATRFSWFALVYATYHRATRAFASECTTSAELVRLPAIVIALAAIASVASEFVLVVGSVESFAPSVTGHLILNCLIFNYLYRTWNLGCSVLQLDALGDPLASAVRSR